VATLPPQSEHQNHPFGKRVALIVTPWPAGSVANSGDGRASKAENFLD